MKNSVLVIFFATLLTFAFSVEKSWNLSVSDAAAKSDSKSNEQKKETICHYPPGNPENMQTMSVGKSAVPAHLAHGDSMGECVAVESDEEEEVAVPGCVCPAGVSSCVCPGGSTGSPGPVSSGSSASQREVHGQ